MMRLVAEHLRGTYLWEGEKGVRTSLGKKRKRRGERKVRLQVDEFAFFVFHGGIVEVGW